MASADAEIRRRPSGQSCRAPRSGTKSAKKSENDPFESVFEPNVVHADGKPVLASACFILVSSRGSLNSIFVLFEFFVVIPSHQQQPNANINPAVAKLTPDDPNASAVQIFFGNSLPGGSSAGKGLNGGCCVLRALRISFNASWSCRTS